MLYFGSKMGQNLSKSLGQTIIQKIRMYIILNALEV